MNNAGNQPEIEVPFWIERTLTELQRQADQCEAISADLIPAVARWAFLLEMDNIPKPVASLRTTSMAFLSWTEGRKAIGVMIWHQAFEMGCTNDRRDVSGLFGKGRHLDWLQKARFNLQWIYPIEAGGHFIHHINREITR